MTKKMMRKTMRMMIDINAFHGQNLSDLGQMFARNMDVHIHSLLNYALTCVLGPELCIFHFSSCSSSLGLHIDLYTYVCYDFI